MPPIHFSLRAGDREAEFAQADDRIDHQQHAEHDGAVARIGAGQHARVQPDADHRADHQRPQPPDDVAQIGADEGLPDVGDDGGHDDDGERVRRRHGDREQAHRHRRQAKPDHALDEAREQEGGGDQNQQRFEHASTLTDRRRRHNLQVTERAFGYDEGWMRFGQHMYQPHPEEPRSGVSKDGPRASWFETREDDAPHHDDDGERHAFRPGRPRSCSSRSPIPAASRAARSASIWRWPRPARGSRAWRRRSASRCSSAAAAASN